MPGFNGKVRCVRGGSVLCSVGDELTFKNGHTTWKNGMWSSFYSSFEELVLTLYNRYDFELVTEPQFTMADLKTGMRIEREDERFLIMLGTSEGDIYINGYARGNLSDFNDDLTGTFGDILNVYEQPPCFSDMFNLSKHGKLLYHRPKPCKMTKSEAEQYISEQLEETVLIEG